MGGRDVCRRFITVRNSYGHFLFINGIGYGLPYTNIRQIGAGGIGRDYLHTGIFFGHLPVDTIHSKSLVVFLIGQKRAPVDHVNLTGLESLEAGG